MSTFIFTKRQQEEARYKKAYGESMSKPITQTIKTEEVKPKVLSRNQQKEIVENTWYKLYLLQNYNITKNMFLGTNLRWSTINTYMGYIRAIYNNKKYKEELHTKSLLNYIHGLMDSGVEPYPLPPNVSKDVSIKELEKFLDPHKVRFIFNPVGVTEEEPDTSVAWTCSKFERGEIESHERGDYVNIVDSDIIESLENTLTLDIPEVEKEKQTKNNPFTFTHKKGSVKEVYNMFRMKF